MHTEGGSTFNKVTPAPTAQPTSPRNTSSTSTATNAKAMTVTTPASKIQPALHKGTVGDITGTSNVAQRPFEVSRQGTDRGTVGFNTPSPQQTRSAMGQIQKKLKRVSFLIQLSSVVVILSVTTMAIASTPIFTSSADGYGGIVITTEFLLLISGLLTFLIVNSITQS